MGRAAGQDDAVGSTLRAAVVVLALLAAGCTSAARDSTEPTAPPTAGSTSVSGGPPVSTTSPPPPAPAPFPAPGTRPLTAARAAKLQAVLDEVVSRYKLAPDVETAARGVTVAVQSDGWAWTGAAGVDGTGHKLVPRTTFAVASITKTFVAAEVLRLAGQGRISLDKPLSTYVKHKLTANNATVRQFLAMRSGVPDYLPTDYAAMDKAVKAAPSRHWTPTEALSHYSATVGPTGSLYEYSNPGYVLLGMLVENVTGRSLATVLRQDMIRPAGLARVAVQDTERPPAPAATARTPTCPGRPDGYLPCRSIASASMANGGMAADAPSIARWGYQLYGGRVVPVTIVNAMTAGEGEYGLGTERYSQSLGLGEAYGHRGEIPGYSTMLAVVPERRIAVSLLMADDLKNTNAVMTKLLTAIASF
jgi:CubicO group peptidase (beta-lactamase class C family)